MTNPGCTYRVSVEKDYLVFCSAHFITYDGHQCEYLHGHNYRAGVVLEGPLDENAYVIDFSRVKRMMRALVNELDHRTLLPMHNPLVVLEDRDGHITATYRSSRYMFPREAVVLLPIPNTTAEMIAMHLAQRLKTELDAAGARNIRVLEMEVHEAAGQSATYREVLSPPPDSQARG